MKKKGKQNKFLRGLLFVVVVIVAINFGVVAYQTFFVETVGVVGTSMQPLIESSGASAYMLKNFYELERGDIIIAYVPSTNFNIDENPATRKNSLSTYFNNLGSYISNNFKRVLKLFNDGIELEPTLTTSDSEKEFKCVIKRVIGLPGDSIQINQGLLYLNGELIEEDYIYEDMVEKDVHSNFGVNNQTVVLGENEYFILGDNRNISVDSNTYGPIKSSQILGKVFLIKQNEELVKV